MLSDIGVNPRMSEKNTTTGRFSLASGRVLLLRDHLRDVGRE